MVLVLEGTNQADVVKDKKKYEEYLESIVSEEKTKYKNLKIDNFLNLYKKVKSTDDTQLFCSKIKFDATEEHDAAMIRVNEFRNQYIHFFPCGWSLFTTELPVTFELIIEIIIFMINDIGNFMHKFSDREKAKMNHNIESIGRKLDKIRHEA